MLAAPPARPRPGALAGVALARAALAAAALAGAGPAGAQRVVDAAAAPPPTVTALVGRVVDAASGEPVAAASVQLPDAARATVTDAAGRFALAGMARGAHRVVVRRLGYAPASVQLVVGDSATTVALRATALTLAEERVTGRERRVGEAVLPATVLEGAALDRRLAPSLAATIAGEPGVTARTNGPMAAQPVVRGLGGDRVLVLEDGQRTGDVATTAPDHAVTIDPLGARRIEIVRGPAGLLYGSNVLGGVVNVVREDVPHERPARPTGHVGAMGESVNRGGVTGGAVALPAGPLAVRVAGIARTARDTRTPGGALPFTGLDAYEAGAGAAWAGARGHVGAAVREVRSNYGVPSSFGGLALPGSHDGGVYVDLRRTTGRLEAEWRPGGAADAAPVERVTAAAQYVRFEQDELERGGFVGTRFGQLAATGDVIVRYRRGGPLPAIGAVGAWGQWRDFRATGSYTGTRPATVHAAAAFAYEEVTLGRLSVMTGARIDRARVTPLDRTQTQLLRDVRPRGFAAPSGAVALAWAIAPGARVGVSASRAFRPPAIEELYSAGPHLATYAYEIGNPELRAERGTGTEAFVRLARAQGSLEVAAWRAGITDYVYQAPQVDGATGLPVLDPRLRRYPVYRATQGTAALAGVEGRGQWELAPGLVVDGTASWVRGTLRGAADAPLPAMPPLRGRVQLRRERPSWFASAGPEFAAAQRRVPRAPVGDGSAAGATCAPVAVRDGAQTVAALLPAEFCPTPAWALLHVAGGVRWLRGGRLHAVSLAVDNALDATWRDHLWRAKQVAPQPGRNVRLLYRASL